MTDQDNGSSRIFDDSSDRSDSSHEQDIKLESASRRDNKNFLPEQVSDWTLEHLQLLNIHYDRDFLPTPLEVLEKNNDIEELTDLQTRYLDIIKFYLPFDININTYDRLVCSYERHFKPELDTLLEKLESDDRFSLNEELYGSEENMQNISEEIKQRDTKMENWINWSARMFIFALKKLLKTVEQKRLSGSAMPEVKFSGLPSRFAELSQLQTCKGAEDPSVCINFLGVKRITSEPDFRLYKLGMSVLHPRSPEIVASVIEVKRASHQQYRQKIQRGAKRRRLSESSGSPATSHKSAIQDKVSPHILGQHGAELLMDFLRPFAFGPRKESNLNTLFTMPGIIVDGTKIYFTLLEMTRQHQSKLNSITALTKTDENKHKSVRQILENILEEEKATIYYSQPFDFLRKDDRDILLDSFMRLNNIPDPE